MVALERRMSVINKMLQDLDRRQALGATAATAAVRAPSAKTPGHEWFWRVLVVLLACALAWMGWVAVQLLPRKPVVTELALQAAAEAQTRVASKPAATPEPPPAVVPVEATPVVSDALRLSLAIETPVKEPAPKPVALPKKAAPQPAPNATVDKRDRAITGAADAHFRRAALLLNSGRLSEAESELLSALRVDARHAAARQAYVALLLEQRRFDVAQRQLQEALALNAEQPTFALTLARLYVGQREHAAALEVLDRAGAANGHADFQAMRGAVLQRLGRHPEAVDAYQSALRANGTQPATSWIGLAISLETLGRRAEAATAYRRALNAGPLAQEARDYAESRARALE